MKLKSGLCAVAACMALAPALKAQDLLYLNEFPLSQVELLPGSVFRHACDLNTEVLLAYDTDRLLAPYLKEAGLEPRGELFGNWEGLDGHVGGHYLSALAMHYAATGREELKQRLDYAVAELARCAEASSDGYIGGVPGSAEVWSEIKRGNVAMVWKRWVPWYNVHKTYAGLRDALLYAGNEQARRLFLGLCDWGVNLTAGLSDEQMEAMLDCEHGGMPEVYADAYAMTGDERYLYAARRFSHHKVLDSLAAGVDNLDNMHANTQVPKFVGFQRIAELGGGDEFRRAADNFWHTVVESRSISIGGNSRREHFPAADDYLSYVTDREGPESCNTNNMLKLTEGLFRMKPDVAYVDFYERALYNHILSTQHPEHGGYVYFTPARPGHYRVYSQPNCAMWCCVGTGMENHGKYGQFIYTHSGNDSIYVNLFIASRLKASDMGVTLTQETSFPDSESTKLIVNLDSPRNFSLMLRHPGWCSGMKVRVNGQECKVGTDASGYAVVNRQWNDGDVVDVDLPMEFSIERLRHKPEYISLLRGPIVLGAELNKEHLDGLVADDARWAHVAGGPLMSVFDTPVVLSDSAALLAAIQPTEKPMHYTLQGVFAEPGMKMELKPFAAIHDCRYMMYWLSMTPDGYAAHLDAMKRDEERVLALDRRTVDAVNTGEQQPEADHFMVAESSGKGVAFGQPFRNAYGGSFSYRMRTQRKPGLSLMVRYWGNQAGNRRFDILADGELVATENISDRWREERFVDVEYALPAHVSERDSVVIAFRAHKGNTAGDVFHVRLIHPENK